MPRGFPAGHRVAAAAKIALTPEAETYSATVPTNGGPGGNCSTASKPKTIAPVKQIVGYKSSLDPKLVSAQFSYSTGYTVTTGVGFSAGGSKGGLSKGLASVAEDRSTEKTWTAGASLKAFGYGIDLSSQDGYTRDASLTYNFRKGDYPAYCGVGGYPGTAKAGYVQVHK